MDATLIVIDSDAELARAPSLIGSGIRKIQPISFGSRRKRV
jgi:hypothetical protein